MLKVSIFPYFYPKTAKKGREPAKRAKYSNFCIMKMTNAIPTKFCTVIKTTQFSLWVVPKFENLKIQGCGRWPS